MIRIEGVRKAYPDFEIEIDLAIEERHIVSVLGPSGSGKTTTLRLLAGFEQADAGVIVVGGRDVTNQPPEKRGIGYVFQDFTLFPHMSVAENVGYGLRVRGTPAEEALRRVDHLLEIVDLGGFGPRRVGSLSGGEQQRVAIARSIAVDPEVLLLDEPFSSVDEALRVELRREVRRLRDELGITVVFVTHSRQEALAISDRVAVFHDGRIVQVGTPEEIYRTPANEFVAAFVGPANYVETDGRRVLVRPEQFSMEVIPGDAPGGESPGGGIVSEGDGTIIATVESVEFHGSVYQHRCCDATAPERTYDVLSSGRVPPGTRVRLTVTRDLAD